MSVLAREIRVKQPGEKLAYSMDFGNLLDLGETLSNPSVTASPAGVTLGTPTVTGGTRVAFTIEGGLDGTEYRIQVTCNTSLGNIRQGDGRLAVRD